MNNLFNLEKFYQVILPTKSKKLPNKLSPSTYLKIKNCPRQWSYENSEFINFQNKKYPPQVFLQSLIGNSIHKTIEDLIHIMKNLQCNRINDENWNKVKKNIKSIKELFKKKSQKEILKSLNNPRNRRTKDDYEIYLEDNIQNILFKIKKLIAKIYLDNSEINSKKSSKNLDFELSKANLSEFEISSNKLNFFGYVDFFKINEKDVEIYDFKTGIEKDNDEEQILLYSLIWKFDEIHNPSSRNTTKLTLIYNDKNKEISPPDDEEIKRRTEKLITDVSELKNVFNDNPIEAKPSWDNCKWCNVKQLCDSYWNYIDQNKLDLSNLESNTISSNIELKALHKEDDKWVGKVSFSDIFIKEKSIIVENRGEHSLNRDILNNSKEIRILNFNYYFDNEENIKNNRIVLNKFSEIFKIN